MASWKCELMDGWRVIKGGDAAGVAQIELKAHFGRVQASSSSSPPHILLLAATEQHRRRSGASGCRAAIGRFSDLRSELRAASVFSELSSSLLSLHIFCTFSFPLFTRNSVSS